jgi:hypothetical protein
MNATPFRLPVTIIVVLMWLMGTMELHSQKQSGAVIFVSIEGGISVIKPDGTNFPPADVVVGKSIYQGHIIEGAKGANAVLLFSNGSLTTLDGKDSKFQLSINEFQQEKFAGSPDTLGATETEPSPSSTKLSLNYGEMYFKVKKLKTGSTFDIDSPIGSAGIRGTDGQITVKVNENGTVEGSLSLRKGNIDFTPPSGKKVQMLGGQKSSVRATQDGQQIGATQSEVLSDEENAAFSEEAAALDNEGADVTLETLQKASDDAGARATLEATPLPPEGNKGEAGEDQEQKKDPRKASLETQESAASGAMAGAIEVVLGLDQDEEDLLLMARRMSNAMALEAANHAGRLDIDTSLLVAAAIRGCVEGAIASATILNAPQPLIERLRKAASDTSEPIGSLLGNLDITQVLATANPEELIVAYSEVNLTGYEMENSQKAFAQVIQEGSKEFILVDSDNDGLGDTDEERVGTDPLNPDTDGDLLMDGYEYFIVNTSPTNPDTDGDGASDGIEYHTGISDPLVPDGYSLDSDVDGLPDLLEAFWGTDKDNPDHDGDGWHDGFEVGVGSDPKRRDMAIIEKEYTVSPIFAPNDSFPWLLRDRFNRPFGPKLLEHLW